MQKRFAKIFINNLMDIRPFSPKPLLRNRHIQTIVSAYLRPSNGVTFERHRLNTPDSDFIDLDFACVSTSTKLPNHAPLVLLLHGLGGSAKRGYACETYRQLAKLGIRAVGMNYRSCSGDMNLQPRTYHAGATEDVALAVAWLRTQYPNAPVGLIGFSLGANMLLKFLGEEPREVVATVAVSPPFDLSLSAKVLANGSGWIYDRNFVSYLKANIQRKEPQLKSILDMSRVASAKTIYEFDEAYTAPIHGFKDAEDYYSENSSQKFLASITTPTLIIRAVDDPFYDPHDIPYQLIEQNKSLQAEFTLHGGHIGFAEGWPNRLTWWANEQAALFLAHHLLKA